MVPNAESPGPNSPSPRKQAPGEQATGPRAAGRPARPLSRREREYRRHQHEAEQAAERLLAVKDYRDITVQDIATEAEFSVGYLYRLFTNKDQIFAAIISRRQREGFELVVEIVESRAPARERWHRLIREFFAWAERHAAYSAGSFRSLQHLILGHPELLRAAIAERDRMTEVLISLCKDSIEENVLRASDPERIARTLRAITTGFIKEEILDRQLSGSSRARLSCDQIAELVERILFRTFGPEVPDGTSR
ncbi:MAG: TetR family transcriptional regulator [Candidatus Eisenbacteria bacterium]|nr:TetR family transcriptional regulator [Candidatus Eisenbacteria bacterium]